jgi:hypothetical protein
MHSRRSNARIARQILSGLRDAHAMKILIISHGYAPALNARAFRWTALAEHWGAQGHEVDVVTVRTGASHLDSAPGVRVHRVGFYLDKLGVYARHSAHDSATIDKGQMRDPRRKIGRLAIRATKKVYDLTWKKLYWPDYALPWIPFAAAAARRLVARNRPELIISVSLPFSSHVAALMARKKGIPWIVDVGDPFSFMTATPTNNHSLYARLNASVERAVVAKATLVTVTNEATGAVYRELFGHADKIRVIPPMFTGSLSAPPHGEQQKVENRLVYIGTLNRVIRSPDRLLAIFDALVQSGNHPGLELHFFGESGDCTGSFQDLPAATASRVKVHGLVSRETAMEAVQSARAVVNIGNSTTFQLPSKLVEYAVSGRPIVNLTAGEGDLSKEFLSGIPQVLTLESGKSVEKDAMALSDFLVRTEHSRPRKPPSQWLDRFTVGSIADSYLHSVLDNASADSER